MNKHQHTPGPWVAEEVGVTDMGPNGVPVYEVLTKDGHRRICEYVSAGDALLIAAAPELLEALRKFIAAEVLLPQLSGPTAVAMIEATSAARSAIAKATGSAS